MSFVDRSKLAESLRKALESTPKRNFKQAVELIVVLRDVDVKSPEGRIREIVFMPYPINKEVKICIVADGDMALKAKESGAYKVITREELTRIQGNRKEAKRIAQQCDWVLVRADLMPLVGRILGPALGPRGKIPIPVPMNADITVLLKKYQSATMIRTKDQPQVMCRIGTEDMSIEQLVENALTVLSSLEGKLKNPIYNIGKIIVKTSMGPPVEVPLQ